MFSKLTIVLVLFCCQLAAQVFGQCTNSVQCNGNQDFDSSRCKCVPKSLNCADMTQDSIQCATNACTTPADDQLCPFKCLCQGLPNRVNSYCPGCMNGGVLSDTSSCKCTCRGNFQGPQCQFPTDITKLNDHSYCSEIDCLKARPADFFMCPNKCMKCIDKSLKCDKLGKVNGNCACECLNKEIYTYSAEKGCDITTCKDASSCNFLTANPNSCLLPFVKFSCPLTCKVCTASAPSVPNP